MTREDDEKQGNVHPAEEGELLTEVRSLEIRDETDESCEFAKRSGQRWKSRTDDVKHEADEAMVPGEGNEVGVDKHNVLEIVNDGFAIEEVVGHDEEVPVEGFAPGVFLFWIGCCWLSAIYRQIRTV